MTEKLLITCTALGLTIFEGGKYRNSEIANTYLVKGNEAYRRYFGRPL